MLIHGGGLATSEQSNQNGWSKTFKVMMTLSPFSD